jgi:hypothetical protein
MAASARLKVTAVHDITERHMIIECAPRLGGNGTQDGSTGRSEY